jgi:hypothetical protein
MLIMALATVLRVTIGTISRHRASVRCRCLSRFNNKGVRHAGTLGLYLATRLDDLAQWPQLLDIPEKVQTASAMACFLANFIR